MMASLMGYSYESLVIDNEMLGMVMRTVRGIEVNEETLSYRAIKDMLEIKGMLVTLTEGITNGQ
jgi:trimethylamine--corrinoid protein Co-methyltransferase